MTMSWRCAAAGALRLVATPAVNAHTSEDKPSYPTILSASAAVGAAKLCGNCRAINSAGSEAASDTTVNAAESAMSASEYGCAAPATVRVARSRASRA